MAKTASLAQHLADILASWGAKFIFGLVGDSILPFVSILGKHSIRFIPLRNEESAAYAASAYAKLTGELGVVLADGGPGTGHLVNGLADATSDAVPVMAITGQVESMYMGTGHKQYINQQKLLGSVTIRSENLANPQSLSTIATDLLRTAVAQGGPVHLSVPKDFWQHKVKAVQLKAEPYLTQVPQSPEEVLDEAADWVGRLRKPMILAGRGASRAMAEVMALSERIGAGVMHTLPMAGMIPSHPLAVGGIGEGGSEAAVELMSQCDGLIKIGATYWPTSLTTDRQKVLAIDAYPANISRGVPADFGVVGDAKRVLSTLLSKLGAGPANQTWREQVARSAGDWEDRLAKELAQGKGQPVLVSGRWRGMGFSLGASIAAKLARPDAQVFCLIGDGGFSMLMGEFASCVELQLPITFVLMNNRAYAMEKSAMAAGGLKPLGVELQDIRYCQVAEACGGMGWRITTREFKDALLQAKEAGKPALIDLQVEPVPVPTAHT
ncbi:MAG: thiamine pyrophosphate-binding protein [Limnochordia bacterium]|jgi:pyruvate oxidase